MKRIFLFGVAAAAALAVGQAVLPVQAQDAMAAYESRHKAMESLSGSMKTLAAFVKENQGSMSEVVAAADNIHTVAMNIPSMFPANSMTEKSRAKAEIWTMWSDFEADAKALAEASNKMLMAAKAGDADAVKASFGAVGSACGDCHKGYRGPKK
ncbi:MAG: cytochrome c [Acetobacterales bacterium]